MPSTLKVMAIKAIFSIKIQPLAYLFLRKALFQVRFKLLGNFILRKGLKGHIHRL